jgi:putative iron-only hydrogenase system regulator
MFPGLIKFFPTIVISLLGRQGVPLRDKDISVISLILEGSTDEMGALTGQIGRLDGIQIKSVLIKNKEQ